MTDADQPRRPHRLLPMSAPKRHPEADSVEKRVGLKKTAIYELIAAGAFPKGVPVGGRKLWVEAEIDRWIAERIAERDATTVSPTPGE